MRQIFFLLIIAVFLLSGCGSTGPSVPSLTPEQVTQIEAASQHINSVLQESENPASNEALQAAKSAAESQSMVQAAEIIDNQLVVQYKNAGLEIWLMKTPQFTPPADLPEIRALTRSIIERAKTGQTKTNTRKAVLINGLSDDPAFDNMNEVFQSMRDILVAKGFNITDLNGTSASPDNLKGLAGDSVIVMLGHGGKAVGNVLPTLPYAVQTGQEWNWNSVLTSSADWLLNRIVCVHVPWGRGDDKERAKHSKSFAAVTGRFWSDGYAGSHFNKALFMNLACSGAKYSAFRDDLFGVGVIAYTGWTEDQGISPYTAWRMLAIMAGQKTLQQAYDELPSSYKHQNLADLWIGKDDGLNFTLSDQASFTVTINADQTSGHAPLTVHFSYTVNTTGTTVSDVSWAFGDGATSTEQSPTHIYNSAGTYNTTFTVTNNQGNTASANKVITVTTADNSILFSSDRDGGGIYIMNVDVPSQIVRLTNYANDGSARWSPDGKKIAFTSNRNGNGEIYVMNSDGTELNKLTGDPINPGNNSDPSWSPDGTKIAFRTDRDGNEEIYVMNADGMNPINLTNNPGRDGEPKWSPDGEKILFSSWRSGTCLLYVMNANGLNPTPILTALPWIGTPVWSPNGAKIAYTAYGHVFVANADGSNPVNITNDSTSNWLTSWSPDGRKFLFLSNRNGNYEIYTMNVDGSDIVNLTNNVAEDMPSDWFPN